MLVGKSVTSCNGKEPPIADCDHEEADTRIVVHVHHALQEGAESILVRTVDTDVVVILVGKYHDLIGHSPTAEIWVAFGMGAHFSFISINRVCSNLGENRSRALPVFHAFTGSDTTSSFYGKGKKTAWQAWQESDDITPALLKIARQPFQPLTIEDDSFKKLERLTIMMYDKMSPLQSVNEARMVLFCKQNRALENIPPTQVT